MTWFTEEDGVYRLTNAKFFGDQYGARYAFKHVAHALQVAKQPDDNRKINPRGFPPDYPKGNIVLLQCTECYQNPKFFVTVKDDTFEYLGDCQWHPYRATDADSEIQETSDMAGHYRPYVTTAIIAAGTVGQIKLCDDQNKSDYDPIAWESQPFQDDPETEKDPKTAYIKARTAAEEQLTKSATAIYA